MPADATTSAEERELSELAEEAVTELVRRMVGRLPAAADRGRHPEAAPEGSRAEPAGGDSLAHLRALAYLNRAVNRCARQEAAAAARAGANYPQLGAAWGISRQGARQRWPGLVFTARPASRPLRTDEHRSSTVNPFTADRPYSVLLVEDDPADAMLIEDALVERGMARDIAQVSDGVAALEYLRDSGNGRPDLIILDLNMPRMNGRELLAALKNDTDLGSIPVVVLTTSAAPDDIAGAYRQHANAYVAKPINLTEFIEAVQGIDDFFLETATRLPRS
ncbi:response regulator [Streptomyces sp. NBC_01498]|uniref:response regulator n=1 Tax=Streptomyces sp. NBC_01498 TaxID=2975870 RepID=UPI002E7B7C84|nr:response regulator [Streptomyces sp. NBC_01498]WTL24530.1 response regulator [Streptomyces sp. NBC_01498]